MSIKVQKVLRFIPVVNFFTVFLCLYTCYKQRVTVSQLLKKLLIIFGVLIIILIPEIFVDKFLNNESVSSIVGLLTTYVHLFVISCFAVKYQEELLNSDNKD